MPFVVEQSDALLVACRYVERNALRAVLSSEWSSVWQRVMA
ncbi:MAG: hypothetical protein OJF50_005398 [Nitrospira sp.]|nr:hypothetical protein [Nitrospira sp.]